jgi:hypothetical protein
MCVCVRAVRGQVLLVACSEAAVCGSEGASREGDMAGRRSGTSDSSDKTIRDTSSHLQEDMSPKGQRSPEWCTQTRARAHLLLPSYVTFVHISTSWALATRACKG